MHIVRKETLHKGRAAAGWHWLGRIGTKKLMNVKNCLHPSKEHIYKIKSYNSLFCSGK